jgi:sigma-B regulation protein RsbU (phosphoserine phosphatase)
MPSRSDTKRRSWLMAAAVIFAAATIVYSAAWMYYVRLVPGVELGIDTTQTRDGYTIDNIYPSSPAEAAGLKAKDLIVAVNGKSAAGSNVITEAWLKGRPGQQVVLTIRRTGEPQPIIIAATFRVARDQGPGTTVPRVLAQHVKNVFPLLFLIVGMVVLFLRPEDRNAWLLALLFAGIISASDVPGAVVAAPLKLQPFLKAYRTIFNTFLPALFYFFFAVFPSRSPLDRRVPWLKWLLFGVLAILGLGGLRVAFPRPLPPVAEALGPAAGQKVRLLLTYGAFALGFLSLIWNFRATASAEDRRKIKVIMWGTLVGLVPVVLTRAAVDFGSIHIPFWLDFFVVFLAFLFPLSFAYAVVKHRVLEIPILLKRSARYLVVQRGFVMLLLALAVIATVLLANAFSARFATNPKTAIAVGATFGVLLISAGTQVHSRVRKRLDRAFFRSAYDAQQILEELASRTLSVTSREGLAALLERHIRDALHPESLAVFLQAPDSRLVAHAGKTEWKEFPREIAWFAGLDGSTATLDLDVDTPEVAYLGVPRAECLVPIRGGASAELQGVAILGPRLSEEPYSSSDKRLLASVATQAGIAMRSIAMAEKMAERMEAERRVAQEMEIARQVQAKLLPQQAPELPTLQCAGACIQTRAVGGDYYDFLDLGSGRLGLVLADISGKGISGALLMANLQANLRSQYALALEDIPRLLRSVNHLFYKNTDNNHYATAFFAVYDEGTRRLRYVNCGHNPPLLLRANGDLERLEGTATVLGLFEQWDCEVGQKRMHPGDVLAIYTDGVTESVGVKGEEYGESRLRHVLEGGGSRSARQLLDAVMADVQRFSVGEQADDLTLVIAKAVASD